MHAYFCQIHVKIDASSCMQWWDPKLKVPEVLHYRTLLFTNNLQSMHPNPCFIIGQHWTPTMKSASRVHVIATHPRTVDSPYLNFSFSIRCFDLRAASLNLVFMFGLEPSPVSAVSCICCSCMRVIWASFWRNRSSNFFFRAFSCLARWLSSLLFNFSCSCEKTGPYSECMQITHALY